MLCFKMPTWSRSDYSKHKKKCNFCLESFKIYSRITCFCVRNHKYWGLWSMTKNGKNMSIGLDEICCLSFAYFWVKPWSFLCKHAKIELRELYEGWKKQNLKIGEKVSQKWGWRGIMWAFHAQSHMLFFRPGLKMSQSCFWRKLWFVMPLLEKLQIVVIYTGHYGKMIWWLQCMCVTWEIRFSFTWC